MPPIPFGLNAYNRKSGLLPEIRLENLVAEASEANQVEGLTLFTRPTLDYYAGVGTGPIWGGARRAGVFNGDALVVSGTGLYRVSSTGVATSLGTLSAVTGPVIIAIGPASAQIATGTTLYSTDGATISTVAMPDSADVLSVGFLGGYFLAVRAESHRVYYDDPLTGLYDGTRFFSASQAPDFALHIETTNDAAWIMGVESIEVWVPTGVDTATQPPFQRIPGRVFDKGIRSRFSSARADNTFFWVGQDKEGLVGVYRGAAEPLRVSTNTVDEKIAAADPDDIRAWTFGMEGHTFYVLSLGAQGTWVFDIAPGGGWAKWLSYGRDQFRAWCGFSFGPGQIIGGDDEDGQLWLLNPEGSTDDDTPVVWTFTGGLPLTGAPVAADSVDLAAATGTVAEDEDAPLVRLRYSDDLAKTWLDAGWQSLGETGDYIQNARWTRLDQMSRPGRVFEFSGQGQARIFGPRYNEPL